jgi:hypothetical protein
MNDASARLLRLVREAQRKRTCIMKSGMMRWNLRRAIRQRSEQSAADNERATQASCPLPAAASRKLPLPLDARTGCRCNILAWTAAREAGGQPVHKQRN